MTSLSGSMSTAAMMSPNDRMKLALQAAVSTGSVKSADQGALSSALDDIDAAMKTGGSSAAANTTPSSMKAKVDSLIDKEVSDGKLTDDQASELKKVFADAAGKMGGPKGAGGPGGPGGPPPPPSSDDSDDDSTTTDSTDTTKSAVEQLVAFLKKLEESVSSSSTYGSTGTSTASASTSSSVLINALA